MRFYISAEYDHTSQFGVNTLFVVGLQSSSVMLDYIKKSKVSHVHIKADEQLNNNIDEYNTLITNLRLNNLWITLEYNLIFHELVLEYSWNEYNKFISLITVKLPYIDQLNYNAVLKIDDNENTQTNPGTWSHRIHDLQEYSKFTSLDEYTNITAWK